MNPFISLLAGVAGAAVYDHIKSKGSMGKHHTPMHLAIADAYAILNAEADSAAHTGDEGQYNAIMQTINMLNQLQAEADLAINTGDEGQYNAIMKEIKKLIKDIRK